MCACVSAIRPRKEVRCGGAGLCGGSEGGIRAENFAARAANLAWKCLATNHSGGKRQTDRKTMRQMSKRESVCVLTRGAVGRQPEERGGEGVEYEESGISHARLHLHILLRIVARLAANRKLRHSQTKQRRSTDKERERKIKRERERKSCKCFYVEQCCLLSGVEKKNIFKAKKAKTCIS